MTNGETSYLPPEGRPDTRIKPRERWMTGFAHSAAVYRSDDEFIGQVRPFLERGLASHGAVMAALDLRKIVLLEDVFGADAARVRFVDMHVVGRNPGAIISAWDDFAHANDGRALWGVGEPAWPGRSTAELEECHHHEFLLNAAFAEARDFRMLCPYDAAGLDPRVVERVYESHPSVVTSDGERRTGAKASAEALRALLERPLPPPPVNATEITFDLSSLQVVRWLVRTTVGNAGMDDDATSDFVFSINELAENSVRQASGRGQVRIWNDGEDCVVEVSDDGRLDDPLVGRRRPARAGLGGRGLWLTHQLCDLVQVRSSDRGTTVRAHMRVPINR
jgi:anti-sigma regulatory factor (Ser/Thr protein kinase)